MTQRPDVLEDFKQEEGPGVLGGQGCPGGVPGEPGSSGHTGAPSTELGTATWPISSAL